MLDLREPDRAELVDLGRARWRLWCWGDPTDPPVVLVHGGFDHGRMFDQLAPALAALGYHVVAPDVRGHGDSDRVDTGFAWSLVITELALLADHLGGPVGIVGHSFGAGVSAGLAGCCPARVRWYVALDGLGPPASALELPPDVRGSVTTELARIDRDLLGPPRRGVPFEELVERRGRGNPRLPAEWLEHLVRHGTRPVEGGGLTWKVDPRFAGATPSHFDVDMLRVELSLVTCPALAICGTEPDTWRDLAPEEEDERAGWLGARLVRVPGAGHYVHLEQPELVLDELRAFVAQVGP